MKHHKQLTNCIPIKILIFQIGACLKSIVNRIDLTILGPFSIEGNEVVFRLALINAFQYSELLPDTLTYQGTMKKIDWKYAPCLPTNHPGLNKTAVSNFGQLIKVSTSLVSAVAPDWLASHVAPRWFTRYRPGQKDLIDPFYYINLKIFAEITGADLFLFLRVLINEYFTDLFLSFRNSIFTPIILASIFSGWWQGTPGITRMC